jgi:hypothetical protein
VESRGAKPGDVGWPGVVGRGGGTSRIERHDGGDGADMWAPCVSGRGERRWVGWEAHLRRESVTW